MKTKWTNRNPAQHLITLLLKSTKLCVFIVLFSLTLSALRSFLTAFGNSGQNHRHYFVFQRHLQIKVLVPAEERLKSVIDDPKRQGTKENRYLLDSTGIPDRPSNAVNNSIDETSKGQKASYHDELECRFAIPDSWDASIMPYVEHRFGFDCGQLQPYLSFVEDGQFLRLNETEFQQVSFALRTTNESLVCKYATVDRLEPTDDFNISVGRYIEITPGQRVAVATDAVNVACEVMPGKQVLYSNSHAIFSRAQVRQQNPGDESEERLSAMLLMLDSTSLGMFRRQLPKTYRYIKHKMKFNFIKGYHRVGYNSFPNMVPILTGKRVWYQQPGMPDEFDGENVLNTSVDHWPFIWKDFSKKGYITMYNEDTPQWGLFQVYGQRGFREKPVDHYFRPYWLSLDKSQLNSSAYCYGNFPKPKLQLDIVRNMYKVYKDKLKFIYTFLCEISHNYAYDLERMDDEFLEFFSHTHESNVFNRTIILLASDHGTVFGPIAKTMVGVTEQNLPVFGVWLPNWFYQKHPNIHHNLRINQLRLSANFDIRATLFDVLKSNFNGQQQPANQRSLSHLYEISANRSCTDAGIPAHYCTCDQWEAISTSTNATRLVAAIVVEKINNYIQKHIAPNMSPRCAVFNMSRILRAEFTKPKLPFGHASLGLTREMLRVAVELSPGAAQFGAQVKYRSPSFDDMKLLGGIGNINRLNAYGSQSDCVNDPVLKKLCYCIP